MPYSALIFVMASSLCLYAGDNYPFLTEKFRQRDAQETKEARIELNRQYEEEMNKIKKTKTKKNVESRKLIDDKVLALENLIYDTQQSENILNEKFNFHNDSSRTTLTDKVKNGDINLQLNRIPSKERGAQIINFEPNSAILFG